MITPQVIYFHIQTEHFAFSRKICGLPNLPGNMESAFHKKKQK